MLDTAPRSPLSNGRASFLVVSRVFPRRVATMLLDTVNCIARTTPRPCFWHSGAQSPFGLSRRSSYPQKIPKRTRTQSYTPFVLALSPDEVSPRVAFSFPPSLRLCFSSPFRHSVGVTYMQCTSDAPLFRFEFAFVDFWCRRLSVSSFLAFLGEGRRRLRQRGSHDVCHGPIIEPHPALRQACSVLQRIVNRCLPCPTRGLHTASRVS